MPDPSLNQPQQHPPQPNHAQSVFTTLQMEPIDPAMTAGEANTSQRRATQPSPPQSFPSNMGQFQNLNSHPTLTFSNPSQYPGMGTPQHNPNMSVMGNGNTNGMAPAQGLVLNQQTLFNFQSPPPPSANPANATTQANLHHNMANMGARQAFQQSQPSLNGHMRHNSGGNSMIGFSQHPHPATTMPASQYDQQQQPINGMMSPPLGHIPSSFDYSTVPGAALHYSNGIGFRNNGNSLFNPNSTSVLQSQAPQYQAPQHQAPQHQTPQSPAPQSQASQSQIPQSQAPQQRVLQQQGAQLQAPQSQPTALSNDALSRAAETMNNQVATETAKKGASRGKKAASQTSATSQEGNPTQPAKGKRGPYKKKNKGGAEDSASGTPATPQGEDPAQPAKPKRAPTKRTKAEGTSDPTAPQEPPMKRQKTTTNNTEANAMVAPMANMSTTMSTPTFSSAMMPNSKLVAQPSPNPIPPPFAAMVHSAPVPSLNSVPPTHMVKQTTANKNQEQTSALPRQVTPVPLPNIPVVAKVPSVYPRRTPAPASVAALASSRASVPCPAPTQTPTPNPTPSRASQHAAQPSKRSPLGLSTQGAVDAAMTQSPTPAPGQLPRQPSGQGQTQSPPGLLTQNHILGTGQPIGQQPIQQQAWNTIQQQAQNVAQQLTQNAQNSPQRPVQHNVQGQAKSPVQPPGQNQTQVAGINDLQSVMKHPSQHAVQQQKANPQAQQQVQHPVQPATQQQAGTAAPQAELTAEQRKEQKRIESNARRRAQRLENKKQKQLQQAQQQGVQQPDQQSQAQQEQSQEEQTQPQVPNAAQVQAQQQPQQQETGYQVQNSIQQQAQSPVLQQQAHQQPQQKAKSSVQLPQAQQHPAQERQAQQQQPQGQAPNSVQNPQQAQELAQQQPRQEQARQRSQFLTEQFRAKLQQPQQQYQAQSPVQQQHQAQHHAQQQAPKQAQTSVQQQSPSPVQQQQAQNHAQNSAQQHQAQHLAQNQAQRHALSPQQTSQPVLQYPANHAVQHQALTSAQKKAQEQAQQLFLQPAQNDLQQAEARAKYQAQQQVQQHLVQQRQSLVQQQGLGLVQQHQAQYKTQQHQAQEQQVQQQQAINQTQRPIQQSQQAVQNAAHQHVPSAGHDKVQQQAQQHLLQHAQNTLQQQTEARIQHQAQKPALQSVHQQAVHNAQQQALQQVQQQAHGPQQAQKPAQQKAQTAPQISVQRPNQVSPQAQTTAVQASTRPTGTLQPPTPQPLPTFPDLPPAIPNVDASILSKPANLTIISHQGDCELYCVFGQQDRLHKFRVRRSTLEYLHLPPTITTSPFPNTAYINFNEVLTTPGRSPYDLSNLPGEKPDSHMDAFCRLLRLLDDPAKSGETATCVETIFRLSNLQPALGMRKEYVEWLRKCMVLFIGQVAIPVLDTNGVDTQDDVEKYWHGNAMTEDLFDEVDEKGLEVRKNKWEKALEACKNFTWMNEWRMLVSRLSYLCSVDKDAAGKWVVKKPGKGGVLNRSLIGEETIDAIVSTRAKTVNYLLPVVSNTAKTWNNRIQNGQRNGGCRNKTCQAKRTGCLMHVVKGLGLRVPPKKPTNPETNNTDTNPSYPYIDPTLPTIDPTTYHGSHSKLTHGMALHQVFDIMKAVQHERRGKYRMSDAMLNQYSGKCNDCLKGSAFGPGEMNPTNPLFPMVDLLYEMLWEIRTKMLEWTEYPWGEKIVTELGIEDDPEDASAKEARETVERLAGMPAGKENARIDGGADTGGQDGTAGGKALADGGCR